MGFLLLTLLLISNASAVLIGSSTHEARNRVLSGLIESQFLIPFSPSLSEIMHIRNASGQQFSCFSIPLDKNPIEASPTVVIPPFSQSILDSTIPLLKGVCVSNNAGWWTIKWCHNDEVRQIHFEKDNKEASAFSLGTFTSSRVHVENDTPLFLVQDFSGGQVCDETGLQRKVQVRLFCCPNHFQVSFVSLQETTLCNYTLMLCWQPLCEAGLVPLQTATSPTTHESDSWTRLRPLVGLCFQLEQNDGWTQEVCFEKSARVFHQAKHVNAKGVTKFSQTSVKHMGVFQSAESPNPKEVLHTYSNGDACTPTQKFQTRVTLSCYLAKQQPPEIISFHVVTKCETHVLMHAPGLCEDFKSKSQLPKTPVSELKCIRKEGL